MSTPLRIAPARRRYDALIGTGGIGAGVFFALNGNQTLGREESRSGRYLDHRDYCKLHIIAHYVRVLTDSAFAVYPLGKVGDDDTGRTLLGEMREAGLDVRHVVTDTRHRTMFCTCLIYPDGSGGNLTVDDSASAAVDAALVRSCEPLFAAHAGRAIALAAPEVPLEARAEVLRLGTHYRCWRAASFTSTEIPAARAGLLRDVDLLAINLDEAAALAELASEAGGPAIVDKALDVVRRINRAIRVSITGGRQGSWVWDGYALHHRPILNVEARGTAGAGDAHLAGLLVGWAAGLDLDAAQELATLVAALSVTSPDTINKAIDGATLSAFARRCGVSLMPGTRDVLGV